MSYRQSLPFDERISHGVTLARATRQLIELERREKREKERHTDEMANIKKKRGELSEQIDELTLIVESGTSIHYEEQMPLPIKAEVPIEDEAAARAAETGAAPFAEGEPPFSTLPDEATEVTEAQITNTEVRAPLTFAQRMEAIQTADEGRKILSELADAVNLVETACGLEPLIRRHKDGQILTGFSAIKPIDWKRQINKLKNEPERKAQLGTLIEDGQKAVEVWQQMYRSRLQEKEWNALGISEKHLDEFTAPRCGECKSIDGSHANDCSQFVAQQEVGVEPKPDAERVTNKTKAKLVKKAKTATV